MPTAPSLLHRGLAVIYLWFAPWATPALAQPSWRQHADLSRAREAVDSFEVVVNDRVVGWQRLAWAREAPGTADWRQLPPSAGAPRWIMSDEIALSGVRQRSDVRVAPTLVELGLRQSGTMGTRAMRITLDRDGARLVGEALTPSGGERALPIDVAANDDVVDDNALTVLLPLVDWHEGLTFTIPVLSSGKGTIEPFTVTALGRGTSAVPAGTFDVWRIAVAGGRYVLEAEVTVQAPYRLVRFGPRGAPMSSRLAR